METQRAISIIKQNPDLKVLVIVCVERDCYDLLEITHEQAIELLSRQDPDFEIDGSYRPAENTLYIG